MKSGQEVTKLQRHLPVNSDVLGWRRFFLALQRVTKRCQLAEKVWLAPCDTLRSGRVEVFGLGKSILHPPSPFFLFIPLHGDSVQTVPAAKRLDASVPGPTLSTRDAAPAEVGGALARRAALGVWGSDGSAWHALGHFGEGSEGVEPVRGSRLSLRRCLASSWHGAREKHPPSGLVGISRLLARLVQ